MRIVFMGTPDFAVASLEALIRQKLNIVAVVTAPDKPAGRGQQLHMSAVKKFAAQAGIPVLQPVNLKSSDFLDTLRAYQADLQVVVAFRMLPEVVWNMPPLGTYNLHASLLPRYRGAAPINWAIINGDTETGVTTFKLQHQIDTGQVLFQEKVPIPGNMTAGQLHDVLMVKGAELLVKTVEALAAAGGAPLPVPQAQDERLVTHAPKLFKEDGRIKWNRPALEIYNRIRGLSPYPGAFTILPTATGAQTLRIFFAEYELGTHQAPNGLIVDEGKAGLWVYCSNGRIRLTDIQLEGKRRMAAEDFLRGYSVKPGTLLG